MAVAKRSKPDPELVKDQLATLQGLLKAWGPAAFMRYFVFIQTKKVSTIATATNQKLNTKIVPFVYNPIQHHIEENIGQYNICLKPRQIGLTTWFLLRRIFVPAITTTGTNGFLISQSSEQATKHFAMLKRALAFVGAQSTSDWTENSLNLALRDNLLHTAYSNRKEIIFDQIGNQMTIGSAEVEEAGQGNTLHHVVASEVARWPGNPEETLANLKEAIVLDGTLDMESTANGAGGYFFEEYFRAERGDSEFTPHFHQWWYQPEYRIELTIVQQEEMQADLHSDELNLIKMYKLDLAQIAFRRAKKKSLRHNFDEKYPEDARTCFLIQGEGFFDKDILSARLHELMAYDPVESIDKGSFRIFHKRVIGRRYVIGADPASGKLISSEKTDFSCAKVLDIDSGEEVAAYQKRLAPEDFALDLDDLGRYYNDALLAVERGTAADAGGDGGSVLMTLLGQSYPNIYRHRERFKSKRQNKILTEEEPGLPMTGRTRPVALNRLKYLLNNEPQLFNDLVLIQECLVFVRNEKGRPEASIGNHDDMVMATAIAHLARASELGLYDPYIGRKEKYGETPLEYRQEEEE